MDRGKAVNVIVAVGNIAEKVTFVSMLITICSFFAQKSEVAVVSTAICFAGVIVEAVASHAAIKIAYQAQ